MPDAPEESREPDDDLDPAADPADRDVAAEDAPDDAADDAPEDAPEDEVDADDEEDADEGEGAVRYPTGTEEQVERAVEAATMAIRQGELVVLPTDTVYGLGADAFDPVAVTALLTAKGRGRSMPPPVLVSSPTTLDALAVRVPDYARALVEAFWPGPLTVVCHQQTSLRWDLGETRGTVAVRMPDDEIALAVLERTGPLAVSSANLTGQPAARDADEAEAMLADRVAVIVDGGSCVGAEPSTIVDVTGERPRVLRSGALTDEQLDEVLEPLGLGLHDTGGAAGSDA